jgi:hypothetical protein
MFNLAFHHSGSVKLIPDLMWDQCSSSSQWDEKWLLKRNTTQIVKLIPSQEAGSFSKPITAGNAPRTHHLQKAVNARKPHAHQS